jgi:hypothetical protein
MIRGSPAYAKKLLRAFGEKFEAIDFLPAAQPIILAAKGLGPQSWLE